MAGCPERSWTQEPLAQLPLWAGLNATFLATPPGHTSSLTPGAVTPARRFDWPNDAWAVSAQFCTDMMERGAIYISPPKSLELRVR